MQNKIALSNYNVSNHYFDFTTLENNELRSHNVENRFLF